MPIPVMTITNTTATGDVIVGPGGITTLVKGLPVACMGDAVAGSVCTGVISMSTHPTVIVKGRPIACLGSMVTGVNPIIGIPVTTVCAVTPNMNDLF